MEEKDKRIVSFVGDFFSYLFNADVHSFLVVDFSDFQPLLSVDCTQALRDSTRPLASSKLSLKIIIIEINDFSYRLWIGNIRELAPNQDGAVLFGVLCFSCVLGLL